MITWSENLALTAEGNARHLTLSQSRLTERPASAKSCRIGERPSPDAHHRSPPRSAASAPRSTVGDGGQAIRRPPRPASPRNSTSAKCPLSNKWTPTRRPLPEALSLTKLPRSEQAAYAGWIRHTDQSRRKRTTHHVGASHSSSSLRIPSLVAAISRRVALAQRRTFAVACSSRNRESGAS